MLDNLPDWSIYLLWGLTMATLVVYGLKLARAVDEYLGAPPPAPMPLARRVRVAAPATGPVEQPDRGDVRALRPEQPRRGPRPVERRELEFQRRGF